MPKYITTEVMRIEKAVDLAITDYTKVVHLTRIIPSPTTVEELPTAKKGILI